MDSITGSNVFSVEPLIGLMEEVIEEENSEILQTNLIPMDCVLHHISTVLQDQQAPEVLKLWLQLLRNCLTQAKNMLHRSNSRQRFLDCLSGKPGRPSKQIKNWRVHFNYLFQALECEYSVFVRGREAVIAPVIAPIIPLMKDVIEEEENREILQTNLIPMDYLLHHISTVLQDQQAPEVLKVWLQLVHNCLTKAKNILHRSSVNPGRPSKQIKNWRVHLNYLFLGLESEFSVFVRGREAVIAPAIAPIIPLMKDVLEEEENLHILQTELRPLDNLLLDISAVFQDQYKAAPEALKIRLQLLHNCLAKAKSILQLYPPSQRQRRRLDCLIGNGGRCPQEVNKWKVLFNFLLQGLQEDFSMFVTSPSHLIINQGPILLELKSTEESTDEAEESTDEVQESVQLPTTNEAEISTDKAEESTSEDDEAEAEATDEAEAEATDEADEAEEEATDEADEAEDSTLSFKDNPVPTDIEECATNIADECKGLRLATMLVAAAMRGKTRVDEWETSLSSIKNAVFSCPDTVHPELHKGLRWCYDALPNSDVMNCFLYCAMYPKNEDINVQELMQMWIAEGFVRSKQQNHLMDMAIGHTYVNLLLDRCFIQNSSHKEASIRGWLAPGQQCIRVHRDLRKMAKYIGEQEENCLLKAGQGLKNFPTIDNENCKRISVRENHIKNLPAEFPCQKLVSLMLSNNSIEELPPGFLASLTSLKVLHLQDNRRINSIPWSVGQLKQLEFLSLRGLESIQDLPEEMCHLSSLQFLDLQGCSRLQSLPFNIGDLKNLKYLCLDGCKRIDVIPHEISQLTSLSALDATGVSLSVEAESESQGRRSIWRNLTRLRIGVKVRLSSSGIIEEGIMGTWLDMRHLHLDFLLNDGGGPMVDLPHDMENMRRLQRFVMGLYRGSSLPEYICKFQHLEAIFFFECHQLRKLSPLERVPNLKALFLTGCDGLEELEIGKSGGFLMLEKLILWRLENLESIGRASDNEVWNESTLPKLRILGVMEKCPKLKRLPVGMDKLPNLTTIFGQQEWWQQIIWEDEAMETRLQSLYRKPM